jgi:acyl transferase domain-containing protein
VKVVLSMMNKTLPASLHLESENPKIPWADSPFFVNGTQRPWTCEGPRRAGISSFGMGGVNAHAILEEAPAIERRAEAKRDAYVLPISARSESSLLEMASRYRTHLEKHPEARLADVCFTASIGRAHFKHRLAIVAPNREEMIAGLRRIGSAPSLEAASRDAIYFGVVKGRSRDTFAPGADTSRSVADECARRFTQGAEVSFGELYATGEDVRRVALPSYAFERQSCWIDFPDLVPNHGPGKVDATNKTSRFTSPPETPSPTPVSTTVAGAKVAEFERESRLHVGPATPSAKPLHPFLAKRFQ